MQRFLPFIASQNPEAQGNLGSKERPDGGPGPGPPMVCQTVGVSPSILCRSVWDLQRCLKPLMERDDLLNSSMLEVMGRGLWLPQPPTPVEEAMLLEGDQEPQEA